MVQAIFYAIIINDVVELRLSSRDAMGNMMLELREQRWDIVEAWLLFINERLRDAQVPCLVEMVYNPWPRPEALPYCLAASTPPPPSILNLEVEVSDPWEITIADYITDFQVQKMVKTKSTPRIRFPDELLAKGMQGNPCSAPSSSKSGAEVASTSTSSTSGGTSSSSSDRLSRCSSSGGASMSSSSHEGPSTPGKSVLRRKGRSLVGLVPEIVAEGPAFPRAPTRSEPQDGLCSHFPYTKVIPTLKRTTPEKEYLLPAGYTFVIPEPDVIINEPPTKCIADQVALNYGLRFPLHPVIVDILTKYKLAPAQRQRTGGRPDETAVSAPTHAVDAGDNQSTPPRHSGI
ncbi:hypothetical protein Cgig2_013747 [Carnegiea gigantea]|uniref:Uncharacterized protein n=1 Tax=Carnegiea gigantea TaxID=171969 RepID=A0A9Q1GPF6_9CARY|nr:hypothetical protein Cgig2_013747 [Carnegiea gigantea]